MVEYKYDAWGNHDIVLSDASYEGLATANPFRYRGYYYDEETGLYYLKSRYYDPEVGRFITIDDISYLDPETINGLNLYAYCGNNPVMRIDENGNAWWHWLLGIGAVLVLAAASVLTLGAAGIAAGGLAGAVIHGAAVGTWIGAGVGADFWTSVGIGAAAGFGIGAIIGAVAGGVTGYMSYVPSHITGFTKHGLNQVISRNGHGVADKVLLETIKAPTKVVKQGLFKSTYKYVGKNAVVVLNKAGKVVTAWAKSRLARRFGIVFIWLGLQSLYES